MDENTSLSFLWVLQVFYRHVMEQAFQRKAKQSMADLWKAILYCFVVGERMLG